MNTKERIGKILHRVYLNGVEAGLMGLQLEKDAKSLGVVPATDQLLGLFLSEEEISRILHDLREEGRIDISLSEQDIISSALSTTLKPSWTSEELDKVLPALPANNCQHCWGDCMSEPCICGEYEKLKKYRDDCKQALLGQGGEK